MSNAKLSVAIITMNRCEQLKEALQSVMASKLPEHTEIVIVDNGSTDDTKAMIEAFFADLSTVTLRYFYAETNLGVGGGRSKAFDLSTGEFVYFLDDDAVIADECRETFFMDTVAYMERNSNVASLTTRIYDEMLVSDRYLDKSAKTKIDGLPILFKYLGGSHFLRRSCFPSPLYFNIKYASEEYAPSILVQGKGYYHVADEHIYIIHKPKVNKWVQGTSSLEYVNTSGCATCYATKRILYPKILMPVLWAAYRRRCQKHLSQYPGARKNADKIAKEIMKNNSYGKVGLFTVIRLWREFGFTVL